MKSDNGVAQAPPVIELTGVNKSYGQTRAADDINLTVRAGEVVALLGPNGAGKTTTIDVALGLVPPDSGRARLFGMSPRKAIDRALVGVVQQSESLLFEHRVIDVLRLVRATLPNALAVEEVMEATGIGHLAKRRTDRCSGGERQRVRLAMSLLADPYLLILDEPTTGMDVAARREFWKFIEGQAERGRAIVFATHYLAEAQDYAARTVVIRSGRVLADEATSALRNRHASYQLEAAYQGEKAAAEAALVGVDPTWEVTVTDSLVRVAGPDLDEAARIVLALPGASQLTITKSSLEDAYTELVEGHGTEDEG